MIPRLIWEGPGKPIMVRVADRDVALTMADVDELLLGLVFELRNAIDPITVRALGEAHVVTADQAWGLVEDGARFRRMQRTQKVAS